MKKMTLGATGIALAALAMTAPAHAVVDEPRLQGRFTVKSNLLRSEVEPQNVGERSNTVWRATPACGIGRCERVTIKRKGRDTERYTRSDNRYTHSGVFRFDLPAADGGRCIGKTPFKIVLRVVESKVIDGVERATKLKGRYTGRATSERCGIDRALTVFGYTAILSP